jgi:Zn-dependent metalloprotease
MTMYNIGWRSLKWFVGLAMLSSCANPAEDHSRISEQALAVPLLPRPLQAIGVVPGRGVRVDNFFQIYAQELNLGRDDDFKPWPPVEVPSGLVITRFQHLYRGLPVFGSDYVVTHTSAGDVRHGDGHILIGLSLSATPAVSAASALTVAKDELAKVLGVALPPTFEVERQTLGFAAPRSLTIPAVSAYRLVYRTVLASRSPLSDHQIDIDALSGKLIELVPLRVYDHDVSASGKTPYNGLVSFSARATDQEDSYWLQSISNGSATYEAGAGATMGDPYAGVPHEILSGSADFGAPAAAGVSVHWATEATLKYFDANFNERCELTLVSIVGLTPKPNIPAGYNPSLHLVEYSVFGGSSSWPAVSFDTVAHELTHCVQYHRIAGVQFGPDENGALMESFADIFAATVRFKSMVPSAGWLLLEDVFLGSNTTRNIAEPALSYPPQPDTYPPPPYPISPPPGAPPLIIPPYWRTDGEAHYNDGPQNKWFFLLTVGGAGTNSMGSSYDVTGVGLEVSSHIAYESMVSMAAIDMYEDARRKSVAAARDLCGEFSQAKLSVEDAWYAVGLGNGSSAPFAAPASGSTGVNAWATVLDWTNQWSPGSPVETQWYVEISTTSDFSTDVHFAIANQQSYKPVLKPSTHYYWRVRDNDKKLPCWRPSSDFTTGAQAPVAKSPRSDAPHDLSYPWGLPFTWEVVPGAVSYTIQVADDAAFTKLIFPEVTTSTATSTISLDVRVNRDAQAHPLYWRVRANAPADGGGNGAWSNVAPFGTLWPEVSLIAPVSASALDPWPVHIEWQPVTGAAQYVLKIAGDRDDVAPKTHLIIPEISADGPNGATSYDVNLRADDHYVYYKYDVHVLGPEPLHEEGKAADSTFSVDGWKTTSFGSSPAIFECVPFGSSVSYDFTQVPNASRYELEFTEWLFDPLNNTTTLGVGAAIGNFSAAFAPTDAGGSHYSSSTSSEFANGYQWSVQTFGPANPGVSDAPPGHKTGKIPYFVQPTAPDLLEPFDGFVAATDPGEDYTNVVLTWDSKMAHNGNFYVEIFRDDDTVCDAANMVYGYIKWGVTSGQNSSAGVNAESVHLEANSEKYSWRITSYALSINGSSAAPCVSTLSACRSFTVSKTPSPPPPPPPPASSVAVACGSPVQAYGGNAPAVYTINLGMPNGSFDVSANLYYVPDNVSVHCQDGGTIDGAATASTGCIGTEGVLNTVTATYACNSSWIVVDVVPDCKGLGDTQWAFEIGCGH